MRSISHLDALLPSMKTSCMLRFLILPALLALSAAVLIWLAAGQSLSGAAGLSTGWGRLAMQVTATAQANGATWVATTDYDTQGELSYHLPNITVVAVAERARYTWLTAKTPAPESARLTQPAIIVVAANHHPDLLKCFSGLTDLGTVSRLKKPDKKADMHLFSGTLRYAGCEVD